MAAHIHTHQRTCRPDEGDKERAVEGSATGLPRGGAAPDALGIGLRGDHAEHQRQASADILQRTAGHKIAIAMMYRLHAGEAVEVGECGGCVGGLYAAVKAAEAARQAQHHTARNHGTGVEQDKLDYAARTGALDAAKEDEQHDEHRPDDGGPQHGEVEEAANHGRRGEHLGHDADEDADKEKQ